MNGDNWQCIRCGSWLHPEDFQLLAHWGKSDPEDIVGQEITQDPICLDCSESLIGNSCEIFLKLNPKDLPGYVDLQEHSRWTREHERQSQGNQKRE